MRKVVFLTAVVALLASAAFAQAPGRGEAKLSLDGKNVTVEYGRPQLRGRDLDAMMQPGAEWRMGSNAPTTLTTEADLLFGDKRVPAGTYVLAARLDEGKTWTLVVRTADRTTVAEVPLTLGKVAESAESLTMALAGQPADAKFTLHWGTLTLSTPFRKA